VRHFPVMQGDKLAGVLNQVEAMTAVGQKDLIKRRNLTCRWKNTVANR
jgi:hypothetical protein